MHMIVKTPGLSIVSPCSTGTAAGKEAEDRTDVSINCRYLALVLKAGKDAQVALGSFVRVECESGWAPDCPSCQLCTS